MKRKFLPISFVLFCFLTSCSKELQTHNSTLNLSSNEGYTPGVIYLKFDAAFTEEIENDLDETCTKAQAFNTLKEEFGVTHLERLFPYAGEFEPRTRREGLHQWYKVEYSKAIKPTKAGDSFSALDFVSIAEPVRAVKNTAFFNDIYYAYQWDIRNNGGSNYWVAGIDVNVEEVWEKYTTGDPSVIVAVVDGGVDGKHEDLAYNYAGGYNYAKGGAVINPENHGTHVAGTIAAVNNNGKGIAGIAGGNYAEGKKGTGIFSCQVFDDSQNGGFEAAIKGGADNGAVISQNSWGYDYSEETNPYQSAKNDHAGSALIAAINYFVKYAGCDNEGNQRADSPMKGGVVFFAAGNENWDVNCICTDCDVVAVGSVSPSGTRASYSNYGSWVDICAPGGESNWGSSCGILSTIPNNNYAYLQGTSMACPHLSGVAALVVAYHGGQGFTNAMLKDRLINGANHSVKPQNGKLGPLVDALGAIKYGDSIAPDQVSSFSTSAHSNFVDCEIGAVNDDDGSGAYAYLVLASENKSDFDNLDIKHKPATMFSFQINGENKKAGETITETIEIADFNKTYYVAVAAFDYSMNYAPISQINTVVLGENHAPTITTEYLGDYKLKHSETLTVDYYISDPDGHTFSSEVEAGSNIATFIKNSNNHYSLRIVGKGAEEGVYDAYIKATDKYMSETIYRIRYEILSNQAPIIIKNMPNHAFERSGIQCEIDMGEYVSDPDGDDLRYTLEFSAPNVIHGVQSGNKLIMTTMGYGTCTVKVTAKDAGGKSCELSFGVIIQQEKVSLSASTTSSTISITGNSEDPYLADIKIFSTTGKSMYEKTEMLGAFAPVEINVREWAPGYYNVMVTADSQTYIKKFLKL